MKLGDRFTKLYHKLFGDDVLQSALAGTIKTLKTGRGLAGLAPVPGLPEVLDVLIEILEKVQDTRSNEDAMKGLCEQVDGVYAAIRAAADTVHREVDQIPAECPDQTGAKTQLRTSLSTGLVTPMEQLQKSLDQVHAEAVALAGKPWYVRFFHSKANTDAINGMKEKINQACQTFQFQGTITIEALSRTTLRELMKEVHARILKDLRPLDGASYRSGANAGKAHYLQATRENVFRELDGWVEASGKTGADNRVFVLVGAAGMGKSTIAFEFCRRLDESERLGASFFFTRGLQGPNSALSFFNTIAFQLATLQPDAFHDAIISAAREHLKRGGGAQQQQLEYACHDLLRGPLKTLSESGSPSPIFVVVDALDECTAEETDGVASLLTLLLSCTETPSSPLRILLTSRPEPEAIRNILDTHSHVLRRTFHDIGDGQWPGTEAIRRDIEAVIRDKLSKHPATLTWSTADPTIIERLVRESEGVFVYASTAVDFLCQGHLSIQSLNERLNLLMSPDSHTTLPHLDNLYLTVLETAFPAHTMYDKLLVRIRLVLKALAVGGSVRGVWALAIIIGITWDEFMSVVDPLQAVIEVQDRDNAQTGPDLWITHTTFRDFLLDPAKMKSLSRPEFHVDAAQAHKTVALGCMQAVLYLMEKYLPELLGNSSELHKLQSKDLQNRIETRLEKNVDEARRYSSLLYYVCNYLGKHQELSTSVRMSVEETETYSHL
ncbi:hypothetical protein C8Q76DRAFT_753389 [Earliella scabrosa]|nr:hypothetical protein C8Q76DRAFT_753389 [Earliella scabrosa]